MDDKTLAKIKRENELSLATHEEFVEFCKKNDVFYWYGEGYQIEALISNEAEFIEFMQKVCLTEEWFGGECFVPFFAYYIGVCPNSTLTCPQKQFAIAVKR
jgi:hypothetical protein